MYSFLGELELSSQSKDDSTDIYINNIVTGTKPMVLHGNGRAKITLNSFSNYLFGSWNFEEGCVHCKLGQFDLETKDPEQYPVVLLAVFIEQATPFLEEQLQKLHALDYPRQKIHVLVHNNVSNI